jgi:hypothetical protein
MQEAAMPIIALDWIYVLGEDFDYPIGQYLSADCREGCAFQDRRGARRLEIHPDGTLRIPAGYAWDGCTPKFALWDIVIGTPDGMPNQTTQKPKAYYASLVHDALYQFLDAGSPITREQADQLFLELLTRDGFAPRQLYYRAVRLFGGLFRPFTRWKRRYQGQRVPL